MSRYLSFLPILLVVSYTILCFFRSPVMADAIIVASFCAIYAFYLYIQYKPIEKAKELVKSKEQLDLEQQIELIKLERELNVLRLDQDRILASITKVNSQNEQKQNFRF